MMSLRKSFNSLKKRHSGVMPQNRLSLTAQPISIPTTDSILQGDLLIVDSDALLLPRPSHEVNTCFKILIEIKSSGLLDEPFYSTPVSRIEYNEAVMAEENLLLKVSSDVSCVLLSIAESIIDGLVLRASDRPIKNLWVSEGDIKTLLIVLEKRFGYILLDFPALQSQLVCILAAQASGWMSQDPVWISKSLLMERVELLRKLRSLERLPLVSRVKDAGDSKDESSDSDSVLRNGITEVSDSKIKPQSLDPRRTRMSLRTLGIDPADYHEVVTDDEIKAADEPVEREEPAPFDPPLRHTLGNGQKFTVAYSDFKTLYNTDWINDTLIDFFIAYEIDRAVTEIKLFEKDEVYAFNSFFFTKLISGLESGQAVKYYDNIKRWLSKIDLMKYESVVIPIMECLHWYGLVIKNLPKLLKKAKKEKKRKLMATHESPSLDADKEEKKSPCEIFVFDSLRQKHPSIQEPLHSLINEYCKDKYDVEIPRDMIRFRVAKVPIQQNSNDCGIHVIYNIQKWLSSPNTIEKVWKKQGNSSRVYFKGLERNKLRRAYIDLLLDLKNKQEQQPLREDAKAEDSEDDIEMIFYNCSPAQSTLDPASSSNEVQATSHEEGKENIEPKHNLQISESAENSTKPENLLSTQNEINPSGTTSPKSTSFRTLDPRVQGDTSAEGFAYQIEHPQIRRLLLNEKMKAHTVRFLNEFFSNHDKRFDLANEDEVVAFVKAYSGLDPASDEAAKLLAKFHINFDDPPEPMSLPFEIKDSDDSNGELNQSVGDLRISSASPTFAKSKVRTTRTPRGTRATRNNSFEIVSDDIQILLLVKDGKTKTQEPPELAILSSGTRAHGTKSGPSSLAGSSPSNLKNWSVLSSKRRRVEK